MTPVDLHTAEGFRWLRGRLGLSVSDVGRIFGLSERAVRRYDDGDTPPHPAVISALKWMMQGFQPPRMPRHFDGAAFQQTIEDAGFTLDSFADAIETPTETVSLWLDDQGPPAPVQTILGWLQDGLRPPV